MTMTDTRDQPQTTTESSAPGSESCWIAAVTGSDITVLEDGGLRLAWPQGAFTFPQLTLGVRSALVKVATGGATEDDLLAMVMERDGLQHVARLYLHLNQLMGRGRLEYTARIAGAPVVRVRGMAPSFSMRYLAVHPESRYVLSRFAMIRREGERLVLETPLAAARGEGLSWLAGAVLAILATPARALDLIEQLPQATVGEMLGVLQLLADLRVVVPVDAEGLTAEERSEPLRQWSAADLYFHSRSRFGRHDDSFGGSYRHAGEIAPLPAVRASYAGEMTALAVPNLEALRVNDLSLTDAIESRVSVRAYGEQPLTVEQLGEFLYRVARVRSQQVVAVGTAIGPVPMEVTSRPYPSGGASYELEFYLTVDRCEGLASGIYHYDPVNHQLVLVRPAGTLVERMVWYAGLCAPGSRPQVLLTLSARFQRVGWKYDAIAYAAIQKHVGVVYQTMYLVATAMGIGGCALGSGDADLFAEAIGTDYVVESSVGDFMLGSLPAEQPTSTTPASTPPEHAMEDQ
jgi:SagB-type dehydrogenase family enzyme